MSERDKYDGQLCMVLIKVSDISNEARPMDVAEPWLDCLLQEFFEQSDREKMEGLPVTPFMDRDKITKPSSQCSFIGFVLLPLFEAIGRLYPELDNLIVNPVREALDYYRKLNEASRRNLEQPASPTPLATSVSSAAHDCVQEKEATPSSTDESTGSQQRSKASHQLIQQRSATSIEDERKNSLQMDHPLIVGAVPTTPISRERSLSQEEEIRRFSFGLDPDTFTEVEICEKTFSFKISTDIRPLPGWSSSSSGGGIVGGNGSCQNGRQPSSAFRRASLAVMSASLAESARILASGVVAARSATNSPTQSGPSAYRTIQEEEDEIPLDVPTTTTTSTTTSLTNGGVFSKEMSVESPSQHNGQGCWTANEITTASAPLASTEDVTDSSVATKENSPVDLPAESSITSSSSSSKARDNPLLIRLRQWTDRFGLSPVRPASAEPPENGITSDVPKSPKLLGSRKIVSTSLSRLFSRSPCHKGAGSGQQQQQQQSAANLVAASKESNHLLFQESSTSSHRLCKNNVTAISSASADVSRSLDNVTTAAATHMMSDSTNHPTQNA